MLRLNVLVCCFLAAVSVAAAGSAFMNDLDSGIAAVNDYANNINLDGYDDGGSQQQQQQQNSAYEDEPADNSNSKNTNDNNNNGYGSKQQTLAKVIPQPQSPQTLNEIYSVGNQNDRNGQSDNILLYLKFPADFQKLNPRNPNALFKWAATVGGVADNAAVKPIGGNNNAYGEDENEYSAQSNNNYGSNSGQGYAQIATVPFSNNFYQEGYLDSKQSFPVGDRERILGRMLMSGKIVDADKSPFNTTEVSHGDDDPRLASCQFAMSSTNATKPGFYFMVTNKSVWAVYTGTRFISKRRVGIRERYDGLVDLGLELDRRQAAVNYYLNGYKVWTVNALGVPPPDDGLTKTDVGTLEAPLVVTIASVSFSLGTAKCLDESDPYTQDSTRLIQILPAGSAFYGPSSTFYEPVPMHSRIDYGQGAIMNVNKLLVVKTESKPLQQSAALPGVYGSSS